MQIGCQFFRCRMERFLHTKRRFLKRDRRDGGKALTGLEVRLQLGWQGIFILDTVLASGDRGDFSLVDGRGFNQSENASAVIETQLVKSMARRCCE